MNELTKPPLPWSHIHLQTRRSYIYVQVRIMSHLKKIFALFHDACLLSVHSLSIVSFLRGSDLAIHPRGVQSFVALRSGSVFLRRVCSLLFGFLREDLRTAMSPYRQAVIYLCLGPPQIMEAPSNSEVGIRQIPTSTLDVEESCSQK